ncbi:MAG: hypothetical protein LBT59_07955, partial [Clostridiales bacterium]|nr:hypothetical protein [Clostridiales bacterium]
KFYSQQGKKFCISFLQQISAAVTQRPKGLKYSVLSVASRAKQRVQALPRLSRPLRSAENPPSSACRRSVLKLLCHSSQNKAA